VSSLNTPRLLVEHLLYVADFTLYLPACFFRRSAVAQVWIPCRLSGLFFHFALRFFESALNLILSTRFHNNKIARYERGGCKLVVAEGDWPMVFLIQNRQNCDTKAVYLSITALLISTRRGKTLLSASRSFSPV
jgi:hypothetical protein